MQPSQPYDLCVLGGGPAGFAAAMRAWDFGKRVCVIERGPLGGAGIHNGALSSKTMWELSRDYRRTLARDRGFCAQNVEIDYAEVVRGTALATSARVGQMEHQLSVLSSACTSWPGSIHRKHGSAQWIDPFHVRVTPTAEGHVEEVIEAKHFLIATGSRPRLLPHIPIDGHFIMTSDQIMHMKTFPQSLVILGAGVIGCEFATIFANFGQTRVNIIDHAERILPFEDEDVASLCTQNLEARGVTVHQRAQLESMRVVDGQVEYTIRHHSGALETLRVAHALISVGRVPNTDGLNLEAAGVKLTDRGHIVDEDTRTSQPHIFAAGDVTFDIALVSVAEIEGRHAVECMFGNKQTKLSYENLSSIMFLDPEVGAVGMNELQAQKKRIPYRVASYGYELISRAIAMRATNGFLKILVTDDEDMHILGMRAMGAHASTALQSVALMIQNKQSIKDLAELWHPHPAVTEGLQECARMLSGTSIFKPQVFGAQLRTSRIRYDS
jgi:dihydrolipoamide dehydrogenase